MEFHHVTLGCQHVVEKILGVSVCLHLSFVKANTLNTPCYKNTEVPNPACGLICSHPSIAILVHILHLLSCIDPSS